MTAINSNRAIRGPVTAVPVVAGKGVRLVADTENNRWVVEADETVLWENASGDLATTALPMNESAYNFETIKVYFVDNNGNGGVQEIPMATSPTAFTVLISHINMAGTTSYIKNGKFALTSLTITRANEAQVAFSGSAANTTLNTNNIMLYKVIGCNRVSASA